MIAALAQINPTVGDIAGNTAKVTEYARRAADAGADLVVFPELCITGYPPKDLLLKGHFVQANLDALARIAALSNDAALVVGYVARNETGKGRALFNAAALCAGGQVRASHAKALLPTYDVFDERRYFEPNASPRVSCVRLAGREVTLGLSICEDLWHDAQFNHTPIYGRNPMAEMAAAGAELFINIAASPFTAGKYEQRMQLFGAQVRRLGVPLLHVNQVGGNDDLVFDGASGLFDRTGTLIAQAAAFAEDLLLIDLDRPQTSRFDPYPRGTRSIHEALVLGTRDYVNKCGFESVVIGLSGGIDSAVTAALAAEALGAERVHTVAMPSRFSSEHSLRDAATLATNLGVDHRVIPIGTAHEALEAQLAPHFAGRSPDVTEENLQARIRGGILMALSNKFGWLVLATGNKSELAVGYCTLYGDMCGGLAVLCDVPKTTVYELARFINEQAGYDKIPASTIEKEPSAELRADQRDRDTLPPYPQLDAILRLYVEEERSAEDIVQQGFDAAMVRDVVRRVDGNEYKRQQAPIGLKVAGRAFGSGRRMPVAARYT